MSSYHYIFITYDLENLLQSENTNERGQLKTSDIYKKRKPKPIIGYIQPGGGGNAVAVF